MVVGCDIEFDQNLSGTFYAGQIVSGRIILKCDKVKEVTGMSKIRHCHNPFWG